jgi:PAS domain S-box-containing protein
VTAPNLEDLLHAHPELRERLEEAEAVLRAIQDGEVDAVFVNAGNNAVYTLESAEKPYRVMVEQMPNGAATLTSDGIIIYCNRRFAELLKKPLQALLGKPIHDFIAPDSRARFESMLEEARASEARGEVLFGGGSESLTPTYLGVAPLQEGAYGLCLVISDLTEQRHYNALLEAQRSLAAVM